MPIGINKPQLPGVSPASRTTQIISSTATAHEAVDTSHWQQDFAQMVPIYTQPTQAIPIPPRRQKSPVHQHTTSSTTPSLQSVLTQRKRSASSIRSSLSFSSSTSSFSTQSPGSALPSLAFSSVSSSLAEPSSVVSSATGNSHPLSPPSVLDDIDEHFFGSSNSLESLRPALSSSPSSSSTSSSSSSSTSISPSLRTLSKKSSFVSNLTASIRAFATTTRHTNELMLGINPRLTDDRLPTSRESKKSTVELETFGVSAEHSTPVLREVPAVPRGREPRINSQFLRLYSYESNSRKKGILPQISQQEENYILSQNPKLLTNHDHHLGSDKFFALSVRQRLWQCVVLPPREDTSHNSKENNYVYFGNHTGKDHVSLIRKNGYVKPWIKLEDEGCSKKVLHPRGKLNNNIQFTVKGWCNSRWLPSN